MEDFNHKHYDYRWTKGFGIAILLALVLLVGSAYAQVVTGSPNTPSGYAIDYTSGNLLTGDPTLTTGTGITTNTGSPTWTAYPSPQGSFGVDGYTFSYPTESLGWAGVNLSSINHGYLNSTAVFVTGFSYGLTYRFPCANSIGTNCDGTSQTAAPANPLQDNLRVEIGYYPATGSPSFITHQLGLKNINDGNSAYNPNWQTLAQTYTFAGAKPLSQAGAVNMEIVGSDAGGWACIGSDCYGPQVKNAYLRANYSVDPCILNPAFNPSCPGFQNILQGGKSPAFYYSYNIAQSLPHIGGGVILHGYDYGFNWWNYGACYNTFMFWCTDWRTDGGGNINFRISDKNNNTMFYNQWYVAGNNSGGGFSSRHLFTESRNSLDMGSVQWWTDSVWNHFGWAGWTRPIWTPDPCFSQPLYSPNCSNFDAEIKRLAAEQKAIQDAQLATTVASISTTPTSTVTTSIVDATTTNPSVTVTTELSTSTTPVTANQTSSTAASTTLAGDPLTMTSGSATSRPGIRLESSDANNLALSLIRNNQQRETAIANQASQSAMQDAASSVKAGMRQAENIALDAAARSQNLQQEQTEVHVETAANAVRSDASTLAGPAPGSTSVVTQAIQQRTSGTANDATQPLTSSSSTSAIVQFNAMEVVSTAADNTISPASNNMVTVQPVLQFNLIQPPVVSQTTPPTTAPFQPPTSQNLTETTQTVSVQADTQVNTGALQINILQAPQQAVQEQSTVLQSAMIAPVVTADIPQSATNFTTDRTNPINDIIENRQPIIEQERNDTNTQQVKSNVQDNDAAAGVSIASIARTPAGFNSYMVALTDANFYAPKEIYRNQKTVDNVRALRQLASDRLHQQMVDQQYLPR